MPLAVEVLGTRSSRHAVTRDVGRHGVFVLSPEPPPERHVVKLVIHTPLGPVPATAWVSRRVGLPAGPDARGAGLELFSLSRAAKDRWDHYVRELQALPPVTSPMLSTPAASFMVRLTSKEKLRAFAEGCVGAGSAFLVTPVLKPPGTPMALHLVHPETDDEFVLWGKVTRVQPGRPKGLELAFAGDPRAQKQSFLAFVSSGKAPAQEVRPTLPPVKVDAPDLLLDVEVDEEALLESEIFDWEQVAQDRLIDLDIDDEVRDVFDEPTFEMPVSVVEAPPLDDFPVPPHSAEELLARLAPAHVVDVSCDRCALSAEVTTGRSSGLVGLVADDHPAYCARCELLLSLPRPNAGRARRERLVEVGGGEPGLNDVKVPVTLLLDVAGLFAPPRCPHCRGPITTTSGTRALEREALGLAPAHGAVVPHACPKCGEGALEIRRRALPPDGT